MNFICMLIPYIIIFKFLLHRYYNKKNVSKKKNQPSIKNLFEWSTTSQVSSPNKEEHQFDLNEDLNILGYNEEYIEELQDKKPTNEREKNESKMRNIKLSG